ncbi:insulinase family protein, partial [candidate division WWE3 bacterium]|nr:insulinase family protein [candidate division WWE3 bacterium]
PRTLVINQKSQQAHICVGLRTLGRDDERRYSLDVLDAVLGNGMSSRLFKKIRDELGLAYYVGSSNWELEDNGVWYLRAGVDVNRTKDAVEALIGELKLLLSGEIEKKEFEKAKAYVKGRTLLGVETTDALAGWYGFQVLLEKEIDSPQEYCDKIDAVSMEDLVATAGTVVKNDRLNAAILGPFDDSKELEKLITLD